MATITLDTNFCFFPLVLLPHKCCHTLVSMVIVLNSCILCSMLMSRHDYLIPELISLCPKHLFLMQGFVCCSDRGNILLTVAHFKQKHACFLFLNTLWQKFILSSMKYMFVSFVICPWTDRCTGGGVLSVCFCFW